MLRVSGADGGASFSTSSSTVDALTDFEPVSLLGYTTLGLAVSQASGLKTLDDLVRHVKANPGKTTYASFGIGSTAQIYGEMSNGAAGLDMAHVPYKGTPRPIIERMSQEIAKIMQTAEGKADTLEKGGIIALGSTPGEFADRLQRDAPRWGEAFGESGVKPQE
jgi:tripartite-type tricarboxylate transporter receptor subunit TctC